MMQPDRCSSSAWTILPSNTQARLALPLLCAIVLAGVLLCQSGDERQQSYRQKTAACSQLPGLAGQLCSSYHSAVGEDKFTAAAHWRQLSSESYKCSGVTVECLQQDMHSNSAHSSCQPLKDRDLCGDKHDLTCSQGFCGGRPKHVQPADPTFIPGTSWGFAPISFTAPRQQQQALGWLSKAKSVLTSAMDLDIAASSDDAVRVVPHRSLAAVSADVNSGWPTAHGIVTFGSTGRRVPETFVATSHEWVRLTDYGGDNVNVWAEFFKMLSPSPVLRLGGASQDKMTQAPSVATWQAMAQLRKAANARFIIGLPLFQKNAIEMSKQMISDARKYLGSSVIGFELGNEPEFWPNGLGGRDAHGKWKPGFAAYSQWFDRVARALNPCGTPGFLSGPGWGNVNTQDPNWLKIIVSNAKSCGYFWETNTHYYPYIDNSTVTPAQLLAQPLQDFGLERFQAYVKIANAGHSLPLRISEANSLYGGGRANLSDTMAGTLWVADALFAFANAGARAFHLHWGYGGVPFDGGAPNVGVQTNFDYNTAPPYTDYPSVHAPWFGYLFWVMASAGGYNKAVDTQFVPASVSAGSPSAITLESAATKRVAVSNQSAAAAPQQQTQAAPAKMAAASPQQQKPKGRRLTATKPSGGCDANIKIWALKANDGTLRVAILNKDCSKSCNMKVMIPNAPQFCRQGQKATLARLTPGPEGMASRSGIEWQGQHYEYFEQIKTGKISGAKTLGTVYGAKDADGCSYLVGMPKASGALLVLTAHK